MKKLYLLATILLSVFCHISSYASQPEEDTNGEPKYYPLILQLDEKRTLESLESRGVLVWHQREDMVLAMVPRDQYEEIMSPQTRSDNGRRHFPPRQAVPLMDVARTHFDADNILSGAGLPRAYTGNGVVVGFCDIGFDPNHINFLDPNKEPRVKKLIYYNDVMGERKIMTSSAEIKKWTTDNDKETHGTHVAGILAGSYRDAGYFGMAPGAEIVAATCQLYDATLLAACEEIIDYAKSVGKPAVINMSVGSYNGPHDGTSLFSRYLDLLGKEAIICLSAGNEGSHNISYRTTFSDSAPDWKCRLFASNYTQFDMYGMTDVWSDDERPVKVKLHVYDEITRTSVYESGWIEPDASYPVEIILDNDPELSKYFTGYVAFDAGVSPLNGRWVTEMMYEAHTDIGNYQAENAWARYNLGLEISAEKGVTATVTADGTYTWLAAWPSYPVPNSTLSISDLATGQNLISVGMYNNRSEIPNIEQGFKPTNLEPLQIHRASSYGTLIDGRMLPITVAPGNILVSSASTPYVNANPERYSSLSARTSVDGNDYYWIGIGGTSMSSPYTAGVIATWLEANPELTVEDVKDIILSTNATDCYDASDPRNGMGWLQPFEGLKLALKMSGIENGKVDAAEPKIIISGDLAEILNPSGNDLKVQIYSMGGMIVKSLQFSGDSTVSVDISDLGKGVYVISAYSESHKPAQLKFVR